MTIDVFAFWTIIVAMLLTCALYLWLGKIVKKDKERRGITWPK